MLFFFGLDWDAPLRRTNAGTDGGRFAVAAGTCVFVRVLVEREKMKPEYTSM